MSTQDATRQLLFQMADDALIMGHRNSEWTGIGPTLEEDIAFSSMAQDKIGHAYQLYKILNAMGEGEMDKLAFNRNEKDFRSCHLVELPIGDYAFSLMRQFFFDTAESIRYEQLQNCSLTPLAQLAVKVKGELRYHKMHADVWIKQLANGTEESKARLQAALSELWPYALGMFEEGDWQAARKSEGLGDSESEIREKWLAAVSPKLEEWNLRVESAEAVEGGRQGYHSEFLAPLLKEMTEVFNIDPLASW